MILLNILINGYIVVGQENIPFVAHWRGTISDNRLYNYTILCFKNHI